jgi:hypothetical protein
VLAAEGYVLPGHPPREPTPRTPWPDWLEWKPNRVWAYDFTHFPRARRAALAIIDVVSRRWIHTLVCAEESSVQVEVAFTAALAAEDLLDALGARAPQGVTATHRVATTGPVDAFVGVARRLFGERLPAVESVEIEPVASLPLD